MMTTTPRVGIKTIKFECPYCHQINSDDEALYGQPVHCRKCQAAILLPAGTANTEPLRLARMVESEEPPAGGPEVLAEPEKETEIFRRSPAVCSFPGLVLVDAVFFGAGVVFALYGQVASWPEWVSLVSLGAGVLVLLVLGIQVKSISYRLTDQRLFVRRGWLARNLNELELYRVKDVVVNQALFQRLLGYGTITVLAADDTTPQVELSGISRPMEIKELIRTQYRAARKREGLRLTEFMSSP